VIIDEDNELMHYGILRRSGRYPWGSGGPENAGRSQDQRNRSFLDYVEKLKGDGLSEKEIAQGMGLSSTTELRNYKSIARNAVKQADIAMAQGLAKRGWSNVKIGERMGKNESTVRSLLSQSQQDKSKVLHSTAEFIKGRVDKDKYVDVGTGTEQFIGVSRTKLNTAVAMLKDEGYTIHYIKIPQLGVRGNQTTQVVLAAPKTPYSEVYANRAQVKQMIALTPDRGRSMFDTKPPIPISSSRVGIKYKDEGGAALDGVIHVRPGVPDVSMGHNTYAQVRIAVDGTHYIKGMAIYNPDLPKGVDLLFHTNKDNTGNKMDALKPVEKDKHNPFGSTIRDQIFDKDGKLTSVMNIVNPEGVWDTWNNRLSSQMLSKQSPKLAKEQLDMTYEKKKMQLDEIMAMTNPAVRVKLLNTFADSADSAAVHLHAAAMPRQRSQVLLPIGSMKDNEIYAPNYRNGERVVLIRHPHGGKFEIPELVVNNRNKEARRVLGALTDAVGINAKVAAHLSGADFDGDHVLVIPNNNPHKKIQTENPLAGLKDFDPIAEFPGYPGMPKMTDDRKGFEMGSVSNLITDMTIKGANNAELARAVRHSMVVIDAQKHDLNYKHSAEKNGIKDLKKRYQSEPGKSNTGASTLISRATARKDVPKRKGFTVDPVSGKKVWKETGESWVDASGKTVFRKERSKKLAETDDAFSLSSGTPIEKVYATHSNRLKALANEARLAALHTKPIPYDPSAKKAYAPEVASLTAKLNLALRNRPLERQAQLIANATSSAKRESNPHWDADDIKKMESVELKKARIRTGAEKQDIIITPSEWAAIQAGAISNHQLTQILNKANLDTVKKLAAPRENKVMTSAKQRRAASMLASGYTQAEVADALGVSLSTLKSDLLREE
jgi:DNA-binding CsgD family transcriptional regulator